MAAAAVGELSLGNSSFSGRVSNLSGRNVNIKLADGTLLRGNFSTRDLNDPGETYVNLRLKRLRTSVSTLRALIPGFNLPPNFDKLGRLDFSGRFDGFYQDFVANGSLRTDLGSAEMDMRMNLKPGLERANYSGNLALVDFDLQRWADRNKTFALGP